MSTQGRGRRWFAGPRKRQQQVSNEFLAFKKYTPKGALVRPPQATWLNLFPTAAAMYEIPLLVYKFFWVKYEAGELNFTRCCSRGKWWLWRGAPNRRAAKNPSKELLRLRRRKSGRRRRAEIKQSAHTFRVFVFALRISGASQRWIIHVIAAARAKTSLYTFTCKSQRQRKCRRRGASATVMKLFQALRALCSAPVAAGACNFASCTVL
jgi:hypothetical protein